MRRQIVIDRIVLEGFEFTPEQQDAFRARLTSELERAFSESWVDDLAERRDGSVEAAPLDIAGGADPSGVATQVASRIVEGVKR